MQKQSKILIIRFSSIGDIILTSPIIRSIKLQKDSEIHYLTKYKYQEILSLNPYIDKIYTYKQNYLETIKELKKENYDVIIDLHNNLKSKWLRFNLRIRSCVLHKENFKKFLLINFGINLLKFHTVERYFNSIKKIDVVNDQKGLDYFIESKYNIDFDINQKYITWCIGGSYKQKKLSYEQILDVCNKIEIPVVFLGGKDEKNDALEIIKNSTNKKLYNFSGLITLSESAYLVKKSYLLLTNDTSLMHIGAAFNIPIISFWGCTKPILGFAPYLNNNSFEISTSHKIPCSKHGKKCKHTSEGCIKSIGTKQIYDKIQEVNSILFE